VTTKDETVNPLDQWYQSGPPCGICHRPGLCRHRDIDADTAQLRVLEKVLEQIASRTPGSENTLVPRLCPESESGKPEKVA
jgi:hypothetical protein